MVSFFPESRVFRLDTRTTSYAFQADPHGFLLHLHYGPRVADGDALVALARREGRPSFQPSPADAAPSFSRDSALQELSGANTGDFRVPGLAIRWDDGSVAADLRYVSHEIHPGAPDMGDLPGAFAGADSGVETLDVLTRDAARGGAVHLLYTVFPETDVIARSVRVENTTDAPFTITRIASAQLDVRRGGLDLLQLPGAWARERHAERLPLGHGIRALRSVRGATGHSMNNAFALLSPDATEDHGEAWGVALCYSGSFEADVEGDPFGATRAVTGIAPELFSWTLAPGESFQAPQAFLAYSDEGVGGMSRRFHDFLRGHVIDPRWAMRTRPALVNNWEATYFDFNSEKILSIARDAAALGVEMLVLDDGWFGHRDDDTTSEGDWFEYTAKVGDMADLARGIHDLGLKFGLWFEPEMISEDSELFRAHPDWVMAIPGRARSIGRSQYVLDFARPEIVEAVADTIARLVRRAGIDYLKYDMNRNHTEVYATALPPERQGEATHRFILGVYRLHRILLERCPGLLIEGCSGGGGRFDAGMLRYTPQIWCSDDSDAVERTRIQGGTSLFYPCSSMGAHVSACPNHQVGRITPFETRATVALAGTFGYELDMTKLSDEDRALVPKQIADFHRFNPIVVQGDHYRLSDAWRDNAVDAWMFVSKDRSRGVLSAVRRRATPNGDDILLRLRGLDPAARYEVGDLGEWSGATLMGAGVVLRVPCQDAASMRLYLRRVDAE